MVLEIIALSTLAVVLAARTAPRRRQVWWAPSLVQVLAKPPVAGIDGARRVGSTPWMAKASAALTTAR